MPLSRMCSMIPWPNFSCSTGAACRSSSCSLNSTIRDDTTYSSPRTHTRVPRQLAARVATSHSYLAPCLSRAHPRSLHQSLCFLARTLQLKAQKAFFICRILPRCAAVVDPFPSPVRPCIDASCARMKGLVASSFAIVDGKVCSPLLRRCDARATSRFRASLSGSILCAKR